MKKRRRAYAILAILSVLILLLSLIQILEHFSRNARELRYLAAIRQSAEEFEVPVAMILAVIRTESDFRPDATSSAGAMGLMQLMPDTFAFLRDEKLEENLPDSAVFDPTVNIRYGTYYLSYLFERFDDWQVTLAAYNAGESRVAEWLDDPELSKNGRLTEIPFPETAAYVEKALSAYQKYYEKYKE